MTRLALVPIALLGLISLASAGEFATHQDYPVGPGDAFALVVADFNGDGKPDVATSNLNSYSGGQVSVLLGNGDGTLQPYINTPVKKSSAYWMATGDFNHDGKADLALAMNTLTGSVGVMLGNGQGGFSQVVNYATQPGSRFVAVADLNRDGNQDLIVANYGINNVAGNTVSVLLGNGDGTYQPQSTYNTGNYPFSIAVADLNGDGILDLAVVNASFVSGTFSVLLGNGDGSFQPMAAYGTNGTVSISITAGDFNKDGRMDLAFTNSYSDGIGVAIGNGDGTFQAAQTYPGAKSPSVIVSADLDGDGNLDLAVTNVERLGSSVSVFLGKGDGTFQSRTDYLTGLGANGAIAARDLNRDGKRDLITSGLQTVSVLLNIGTD